MSPHVVAAAVTCLGFAASGFALWKGLGTTPPARKLPYELVPLVQLAMVAYAAICASIWSDGTALSYVLSAAGLIQAALDPLLAKGLEAAESADDATGYANAIDEQLTAQQVHLERSEQARQNLEKTRRSLVEQFSKVESALETEDVELAKSALSDAERSIPTRGDRLCRNAALDALLQDKRQTCAELGINLDIRVGLGEELPIPTIEVCAIIANLLDNAINACKSLAAAADSPTITLAARETKGHLALKVENPYAEKNTLIDRPTSTRLDLTNLPTHGWGTGIVQTLTARHHGSFETEAKDGHFTATVLVPISRE